jgi:deoxycytidylate deaminase
MICAKMLINAGVKNIVFEGDYGGDEVKDICGMFFDAEITVFKYTPEGMESIV